MYAAVPLCVIKKHSGRSFTEDRPLFSLCQSILYNIGAIIHIRHTEPK